MKRELIFPDVDIIAAGMAAEPLNRPACQSPGRIRRCLSAPVELEVSAADRLQAAPSGALKGRLGL